jgi:hypothetical protein
MKRISFFILFALIINPLINVAQEGNFISLKQVSEMLENKKKSSSLLYLYFDKNRSTLTKYINTPDEIITVTNRLGEVKIYYPETNQVTYMQSGQLSSQRSLIHYFANHQTEHLGLADEGFQLESRKYEGQYLVTEWKSPSGLKMIDRVKMVFDGANPIYAEYLTTNKSIFKKIYYTGYHDFGSFRMPLRITEINYQENGDSTINRTIFSEFTIGKTAHSEYFNFKIPDDAKPITNK